MRRIETLSNDTSSSNLKKPLLFTLVIIILIKLLLMVFAHYSYDYRKDPNRDFLSIWSRWDSKNYKTISETGYKKTKSMSIEHWAFMSNFPPLYSQAISFIKLTNISFVPAGIFVSFISIILASWVFFKLIFLETGSKNASVLGVLFLNLFPTSYFTISVYAESLFLLLSIGCFYFLKTRKYLIAGIFAGLAILTRNIGIVLIPTLYIYAAYETYKSKKFDLSMLHVLLIPLLAFSIYLLINYDNYGDPFFFYNEKISFDHTKQLMIPFSEHLVNFSKLFDKGNILDEYFMMTRGWNAIFPFFSLVVIIFGLGKIRWHYSLYAFFSIILFSSLSWGISDARYCLTVFPIYMVLAKIRNKYIILSLMGIFLILMLNFTAIFTSGRWGF